MQRITITIDDDLLDVVDKLAARRGYASRSEAIRDLVRAAAVDEAAEDRAAPCWATLTYVYDHHTRDLARRITGMQHHHHDLSVSTLHVHMDHHECLEVSVLKGPVGEVRDFADSVVTQRGVWFGRLQIFPGQAHAHGDGPAHDH